MSDGFVGKDLYIKFGDTVLNSNFRTFGNAGEVGLVDSSAGAQADRTYLQILKDGTAQLSLVVPAGSAGTAMRNATIEGASGTLEWGPEGTASGKPKFTKAMIVKSQNEDQPYDEMVVLDITFQGNGAKAMSAY